jgi:ABC-type transporter Mla subunit MlaD
MLPDRRTLANETTEEDAMATKGSATRRQAKSGSAALDRLGGSLDAAQDALKDLRRELSKGGRDMLKDLDVLLRDARKNLRGTTRTLVEDLEELQKAAAGKRSAAATRAPAKRPTATKRTGTTSGRKAPAQRTRSARRT